MTETKPTLSIHRQRVWFYVLWVSLLCITLGAWYLWERPVQRGYAKLTLRFDISGLPPGTQASLWCTSMEDISQNAWRRATLSQPSKNQIRMQLETRIAWRRWVKDYIPRLTDDVVVVRFEAPQASARYFFLDLREDIYKGWVRIDRDFWMEVGCAWHKLNTDLEGGLALLKAPKFLPPPKQAKRPKADPSSRNLMAKWLL